MNVAIINCFDTYEQRVDLVYNFFINRGDIVRIYASDYKHIEKVYLKDKKKDHVYINVVPYKKNISVKRLYSHYKFSKDVFDRLDRQNLDLIWLLVPPNSLVKQAAILKKKKPSIKIIADIMDMWPETLPFNSLKKTVLLQKWTDIRDTNLKYMDYIITECDLFKKKLKQKYNFNNISTLYLARQQHKIDRKFKLPIDKISFCYLGSINNIIDIDEIVNIFKKFREYGKIELHIIGDGEKRNKLITDVQNIGVSVIYHGLVYDYEEKQKIINTCHYGLNIMKESVIVGLTMKSIDYFEFGLPIINNIKGDTWNIINKFSVGYNVVDLPLGVSTYSIDKRYKARKFFELYLTDISFYDKLGKITDYLIKK